MGKKILRAVLAVLIILNMGAIFFFSAQKATASDKTSDGFITVICKTVVSRFDSLSPQEKEETVASLRFAVRKAAHMTEFASLAFLSYLFLSTFGREKKFFLFAFGFSSLYGATDEFHQLFVEGRSGQFSDVLVDSAGALFGALFAFLLCLAASKLASRHSAGLSLSKNESSK